MHLSQRRHVFDTQAFVAHSCDRQAELCWLFAFRYFKNHHQNYHLPWETSSQSKQVPPTSKATNGCRSTTLPETLSKHSLLQAQTFPNSHIGNTASPADWLCSSLQTCPRLGMQRERQKLKLHHEEKNNPHGFNVLLHAPLSQQILAEPCFHAPYQQLYGKADVITRF